MITGEFNSSGAGHAASSLGLLGIDAVTRLMLVPTE